MSKSVSGFVDEHEAVNWDGMVPTGKILKDGTREMVKELSMTKQSFKDECDINNIIKRFDLQVATEHLQLAIERGYFVDLPSDLDFQEMQNQVAQARQAFEALSGAVRARFHNDPQEFLAFMQDPSKQQEAIDLGLATLKPEPAPPPPPMKVEVVNPESKVSDKK